MQWSDIKHFNKELMMTKKDNEDFKYSTICWICENDYFNNDVKVKDHCHIEALTLWLFYQS